MKAFHQAMALHAPRRLLAQTRYSWPCTFLPGCSWLVYFFSLERYLAARYQHTVEHRGDAYAVPYPEQLNPEQCGFAAEGGRVAASGEGRAECFHNLEGLTEEDLTRIKERYAGLADTARAK